MSRVTQLPERHYQPNAFADFRPGDQIDIGSARALIWLSQLAYESSVEKIKRILTVWELELIRLFSREVETVLPLASTGGLVARGRGSVFVAFAGTDPFALADWLTDFSIRPDPKTGVEEGFKTVAKTACCELKPVLNSEQNVNLRLYVAGHSLGGAIATVFGSMVEAAREVDGIYTFGMPRPGKEQFAARFAPLQNKTFRFIYGDDIVPTVAPADWGFRHVGRYIACPAGDVFSVAGPLQCNDLPMFDERYIKGLANRLAQALHAPLSGLGHVVGKIVALTASAFGDGPARTRTDWGGLLIDTLPPPLRDHMPDRYIQALGSELRFDGT